MSYGLAGYIKDGNTLAITSANEGDGLRPVSHFLSRDSMLSTLYAIARPSVTRVDQSKTV